MVAPALARVEVGPDQVRQVLQAGRVHGCRPVPQVLALAPVGQRVGMIEPRGPRPAFRVIQERGHGPVVVARQRRKLFDEGGQPVGIIAPLPARFV